MASLSSGTPDSVMQSEVTLPISVTGCAIYTPARKAPAFNASAFNGTAMAAASHQRLAQPAETPVATPGLQHVQQVQQRLAQQAAGGSGAVGANCVSAVSFWKGCLHKEAAQPANGRCAVIQQLPAGPLTAFFPQPNQFKRRTYKGVMGKPTSTGNAPVDAWFKAAQALVGAQLNELAGVVLSPPVTEAVSLVGSVVGTATTVPPTLNMQQPGVATAVSLLEMFNAGQVRVRVFAVVTLFGEWRCGACWHCSTS